MFDDRIGNLQKMLARMGPEGRQRYAADHADDPIAVSMALFVNNIAKELKEGKQGEPELQAPVVQQAIQAMNQPRMPQGMPPQGMPPQGQPQAPQGPQAPQAMPPQMAADGGYMDSRLPEDMGIGALPERSLSNMADGGIVGFADGGTPKGKKLPSFNDALEIEGITDPRQQAFLKALYGQESGSGANTTTSNQGAVGHMQIKPGTFKQVADKGMDINNAFDNMRAGIRYGMQGYRAAGGDPVLAGAYYYGGPGGMEDLANGEVRTDPKNPKAPNTLEYGKSIAQRMTALLPIGTAQAETPPSATAPATKSATTADLQALRQSDESFGDKLDTLGQTARSLGQNAFARVASGWAGLAGAVDPTGPKGQGADYVKRVQEWAAYHPEALKEDSKKILGALGYPLELANKYVGVPVGDFLAGQGLPAAGAIAQGVPEAALAALGLLGRGVKATGGAKPAAPAAAPTAPTVATAPAAAGVPVRTVPTAAQRAAAAQAVPKPAAAPTPAIRTTLTPEQINAGLGAPPLVGPRKPTVVPAPKTPPVGGLATISPEAAALRAAAEARSKARAAERTAAAVAATERPPAVVAAERPPAVVAADAEAAGAPKPAVVAAAEAEAAAARPAAAAAAGESAAARPAAAAERPPAVVAAGEGAAATRPGLLALLPAAVAAGAVTGSGANSSETPASWDKQITDRDFADVPNPVKKEAVAEATKAITASPEPDRLKGFGYEDLLMFGLQLMAGKSQYALQNVGEAGVAALASKQAREKAAYDRRKTDAEIKGSEALARKYGAEAQTLEAETKTDSAMRMKAATLAQGELEKWAALPQNFNATPAQVTAKRNELMRTYFDLLGQSSTIGGGEFKVLGSRASP